MKFHFLILSSLLFQAQAHASLRVIIGQNEIEKLSTLDSRSEIYQRSKPTGRLELPGKLGIHDYCTVALISENRVLTAAHCLTKRDPIRMKAYFEYYTKDQKKLNPYPVQKVLMNDTFSDVAILELAGAPGKNYGHYAVAKQMPEAGSPLIVFEHPGLDEKSVSRKNCSLKEVDSGELFHTCDTENYSSGSPILNSQFEIIGVHQGSIANGNDELNYGRIVAGWPI